jgi:DNA-binding SARP family transcriptional activator
VLTWRSARPQARASGCPPGGFDDRRRGLQAAGAAGGGRLRPGCADSAGEAAGSARPLLLSGGQIVTVDQLAELLWSTSPPPSATITIQNYVRRLRLALGAAGRDRIVTQPGGYVIRLEPGELDVITMEQELAAARRSARDSAWPLAAGHAAAALALWRGEPLSGVDVPLLALQEIPRLAELRLQAQELRIEADLRMGRDAELLTELRQLTRTAPLREHLHALLIRTLYLSERRAEALEAYQAARDVLIEGGSARQKAGPSAHLQLLRILRSGPGSQARRAQLPDRSGRHSRAGGTAGRRPAPHRRSPGHSRGGPCSACWRCHRHLGGPREPAHAPAIQVVSALALLAACLLAFLAASALAIATVPKALMIIRVEGRSMSPTYEDQQRLLVRRGHRCRRHDVVVFSTSRWDIPAVPAMLVKRVAAVPGDTIPVDMASVTSDTHVPTGMVLVRGDNGESLDSGRLGYVPASSIIGVVLTRLAAPQ